MTQNASTLQALQAENDDLQRQCNMLYSLVDQFILGIYIYQLEDIADDRTLRMVYANPIVEQLAGLPPVEIVGKTLDENFPRLREQGLPQVFADVVRTGKVFETESVYGDERIIQAAFLLRALPLPEQRVAVTFENITQRKQAERDLQNLNAELEQRVAQRSAELQRSQALLQSVINNTPSAIYIKDLHGRFLLANEPTARLMHLTTEQLVNQIDSDLFPPEYVQQWRDNERQVIESGKPLQMEETAPQEDGLHTFYSVRVPVYDEHGTVYAIGGISTDITERKRAEESLHMTQFALDKAVDSISWISLEGDFFYVNDAFCELLGYTHDELLRMQVHHIDAHMEPEQWPTVRDMMKHEKRIAFETNLLRKDGSQVPVEVIGNYLVYNELVYFCTFARDLTERKQVEAEREAAQQQVIDAQREALRELSTPLIPIAEGVVIMPLIGSIDSLRAQMVMEALLEGVARHRAHSVILDITGVQVVDTQVANTFISAAQAVRLLGAQVIMSGIQPAIAQTLVQLGVDLSGIITVSSLQAGIAHTLLARQG